ncbi:hypothetical protein DM02DRAFT_702893 [Periconia macrospinosa]|uniref:Uncharacterized protein n=1 Tax=Periconia macrospinosa TaxID=97972 RepID=A0A2V1DZ17_9PLEO|nr:hypothetical protein DM02DRAFT_702893 [Periconia macrospinosa]
MTTTTPRIEFKLQASGTCYLSNEPPFYFILDSRLPENAETERAIFLEDGFAGSRDYQPINSNRVIQCLDYETGEQVQVLHQGTQPVFDDIGFSQFTTSDRREPYDLPFITSSLRPDRKYILRFKPTTSISHWPATAKNTLDSLAEVYSSSASRPDIPAPSTEAILWEAADGNDAIIFKTRSSQPSPPNVTVSLSAPSTWSLSQPFLFTLTFSIDAEYPITVLADRSYVKSMRSDISIREATLPIQDFHNIDICSDVGEEQRQDFLRLKGTFTEHRELDVNDPRWGSLKVGKEYILRHLSGTWWWTDESLEEVMAYLKSKSSLGLPWTNSIKFSSAGEVKFKVVE